MLTIGFTALALTGGVWLVLTPRVLHAALALLLTLLAVAALFVLQAADVVAAAQLMAYVGGVLVLTLFGIMLSTPGAAGPSSDAVNRLSGWALGGLTFGGMAWILAHTSFEALPWRAAASGETNAVAPDSVVAMGTDLLTTAVLPVEIASLVLLVALIAAATIAGGEPTEEEPVA